MDTVRLISKVLVIARAKLVAERFFEMFKTLQCTSTACDQSGRLFCIVMPLVVRQRTTSRKGSSVQLILSLKWSYNWKTDGATYRTTSRSVLQLLTTGTDWLHNLTLGGVAAGLRLVLWLVDDSQVARLPITDCAIVRNYVIVQPYAPPVVR
jgi:hypothetical protein